MSDGTDLPWMKFYPSDFMGSQKVRSMTGQQRGIYISLMCECWEAGSIPDDPDQLWTVCGVTPDEMREAWPKVRQCFEDHPDKDGHLVQPRVETEREAAVNRRNAAQKAAQARQESADRDASGRYSGGTSDSPASGGSTAPAGGGADGSAGAPADAPAMRASDASDVQKHRDTDGTEVPEVETTDSDESELRSLADLGRDPPGDEDTRKQVTDALVKAWLSLQPERPPEKQIGKQGAVAKRLAEDTAPRKLAIALYGMEQLWEHREAGNPWDLFDFEKKLSKALKRGVEAMRNGGGSPADQKLEERKRDTLEAIS